MRKTICAGLSIALILGSFGMAFAADNDAGAGESNAGEPAANGQITEQAAGTMEFTGEAKELSLEAAIKIMTTEGPGYQEAELVKEGYEAASKGQSELLTSLKEANVALGGSGLPKTTTVKTAQRDRDFYKALAPVQFQADLNGLESQAISTYYGVLQAEDYLKVSKEDLQAKKDILNNVNKKFNVGMASKVEVMSAESNVTNAENAVEQAESALKSAKMSLNIQMGFDLMQNVTLTDKLVRVEAPALDLAKDIESAKKNRVEIMSAKYALESAEADLLSIEVRYPKSSATYKTKKIAVEKAQKGYNDALQGIEMEIRTKYMGLVDGEKAIKVAEETVANAEEAYRIAKLTYEAGMNTLVDVQSAQIAVNQAQMAVSKAIVDYDLAVYAYKYAKGAGASGGSAAGM